MHNSGISCREKAMVWLELPFNNLACRPGQAKRVPGPITSDFSFAKGGSPALSNRERLWLWIPAPVRNCALGRDDDGRADGPPLA
jgi:hypothetical protein